MKQLPDWTFSNPDPAFYDIESKTAVQMVTKFYQAMQTLIAEYNEYAAALTKDNETYKSDMNSLVDAFKTAVNNTIANFINCVEHQINVQNKTIADAIDEIIKTAQQVTEKAIINGEVLKDATARALALSVKEELDVLTSRMNVFASLSEGSTTGDAELQDIRVGHDGTIYKTAGISVRQQISDTNKAVSAIRDEALNIYNAEGSEANLLIIPDWISGYYLDAGIPKESANYSYCDYIDITDYETITIKNSGQSYYAFYDINKELLGLSRDGWANIMQASTTVLTPHEDAVFLRFSCRTADLATTSVTGSGTLAFYTLNRDLANNDGAAIRGINSANSIEFSSLSAGVSRKFDNLPHTLFDVDISFSAKVDSFDSFSITHGNNVYNGAMLKIDNTNITVYRYLNSLTVVSTQAHGLTISDLINIVIKIEKQEAVITISTKSGVFTSNPVIWYGARPDVHIYSYPGTNLTNCRLTWNSNALKKGIWWFGDSYMTGYSKILCNIGYGNAMFDGYSGRASAAAWDSLNAALAFNTPNVIVWSMGMNDADTDTAINGSWQNRAEWLMQLCRDRQIELIFLTIPNVPDINNTFKNEFIKASGCRYIDIAELVGATEAGSTWLEGLLGSDNLHASDVGKQIIASYIAAQLPQLRSL